MKAIPPFLSTVTFYIILLKVMASGIQLLIENVAIAHSRECLPVVRVQLDHSVVRRTLLGDQGVVT